MEVEVRNHTKTHCVLNIPYKTTSYELYQVKGFSNIPNAAVCMRHNHFTKENLDIKYGHRSGRPKAAVSPTYLHCGTA